MVELVRSTRLRLHIVCAIASLILVPTSRCALQTNDDTLAYIKSTLRLISDSYPAKYTETKNRIADYINIHPVDFSTCSFDQGRPRDEAVVDVLLKLRNLLPLDCTLKEHMNALIVFTILRKYFQEHLHTDFHCAAHVDGYNPSLTSVLKEATGFISRPAMQIEDKSHQSPNIPCNTKEEIVKDISPGITPGAWNILPQYDRKNATIKYLKFLLPTSQNVEEKEKIKLVTDFLDSGKIFEVVPNIGKIKFERPQDFLNVVVNKMQEQNYEPEVQNAFEVIRDKYYAPSRQKAKNDEIVTIDELIDVPHVEVETSTPFLPKEEAYTHAFHQVFHTIPSKIPTTHQQTTESLMSTIVTEELLETSTAASTTSSPLPKHDEQEDHYTEPTSLANFVTEVQEVTTNDNWLTPFTTENHPESLEILSHLPPPEDAEELHYHNILQKWLQNDKVINTVKNSTIENPTDFVDVLRTVLDSQRRVEPDVEDALDFLEEKIEEAEATTLPDYEEHTQYTVEDIRKFFEEPKTEEEQKFYDIMQEVVEDNPEVFNNISTSEYPGALIEMAKKRMKEKGANPITLEAFQYYENKLRTHVVNATAHDDELGDDGEHYMEATLLELFPYPHTAEEEEYYKIVKSFIYSDKLMLLIEDLGGMEFTNSLRFLNIILKKLIQNKFDEKIIAAFKFYEQKAKEDAKRIYWKRLEILIGMIPESRTTIEEGYFSLVKTFLSSSEALILLSDSKAAKHAKPIGFLTIIMKKYSEQADANPELIKAFQYVDSLLRPTTTVASYVETKTKYSFETILTLLPEPTNDQEVAYYGTIKDFLVGPNVTIIIPAISGRSFDNSALLLNEVVNILVANNQPQSLIEAFQYYVQLLTPNLETLTEEIRKQFNLTSILLDAIQVDKLDKQQKKVFDEMFNFVVTITSEQLSTFDTWLEANTKGEFAQIFFDFLLESDFVPKNIKEDIAVLKPLVHLDGNGALPI